ncbi:MAG: antibiotic biosynthesis monooxygenase family protein [Caulobacterales bacterium]
MPAPIIIEGDAFVSRYTVKPEKKEEFIALFNELWKSGEAQLREVTHFVFYGWSREDEFVAIESWKSPEFVAAVRQSEEFKDVVSRLLSMCSKPMTMEAFNGMNSDGYIFKQHPKGASTVHPKAGDIGVLYL